jgi:hydrogenase maturation protease
VPPVNRPVLVVGYGNPLRADDGIGWHAAGLLARDRRLAGARVLARQQLTPELAEDLSGASLAVLVDAAAGGAAPGAAQGAAPGAVSVRRVEPGAEQAAAAWSHHLSPEALAGLTAALYGAVPPVFLVSVAGASFDPAERLSPELERALPGVVDTVAALVAEHAPA